MTSIEILPATGIELIDIVVPGETQVITIGVPGIQGAQGPAGSGGTGSTADATTTTKGSIQLAGDLAGTASAPTVPGLAGKANTTHTHTATDISNSTATGRSLITATDAATARTAIGAGTSSLVIGTTASTAMAGNKTFTATDVGAAPLSHTHVVADISATGTRDATTYLRGDGIWAVPPGGAGGGTVTSANITDATAIGRTVLTSVDATAVRTAIGAGTSSLAIGTTGTTAAAGNHTHLATNISDSTTVGRSVLTAIDAAAARTAIGAGTSSLVIGTTSTTAKAGDYSPPADAVATTASMRTLGTGATQAAAGNDSRLSDARTPTAHTHTASNISDSTVVGRSVLMAVDATAARTAIAAGTSSLVIGTTAGTAAAGNDSRLSDARTPLAHTHGVTDLTATGTRDATTYLRGDNTWAAPASSVTSSQITDATATGRSVLTAADAAAVRTISGSAPLAGVEGIKTHDGTTGGGTRPTGFSRVRWVGGTTRPTNMISGDIWEHDA